MAVRVRCTSVCKRVVNMFQSAKSVLDTSQCAQGCSGQKPALTAAFPGASRTRRAPSRASATTGRATAWTSAASPCTSRRARASRCARFGSAAELLLVASDPGQSGAHCREVKVKEPTCRHCSPRVDYWRTRSVAKLSTPSRRRVRRLGP